MEILAAGMEQMIEKKIVDETTYPWRESPYYAEAEKLMHIFWGEKSAFREYFETLNLTNVLELACGKGRHSAYIVERCHALTLVDFFPEHIVDCVNRLSERRNVCYVLNNGYDFSAVPSESQTSVFCYDAMVHFAPEIVESYLKDTYRVLKPGGRALFHHSNFDAPQDQHYGRNPHARNSMTMERFGEYSRNANLEILHSVSLTWGKVPDLDGLTLLEKREP